MNDIYLCPKCNSNQISMKDDYNAYRCFGCGNYFTIKTTDVMSIKTVKIRKPTNDEMVLKDYIDSGGEVLFEDIKTFEYMVDDPISHGLCGYCGETDRGERACYATPDGFYSCEGRYCESAYHRYVECLEETRAILNTPIDELEELIASEGY